MRTTDLRHSRIFFSREFLRFHVVAATVLAVCIVNFAGCAAKIPPVKTYEQAAKEVDARGSLISPPIEQREGYEEGTATKLDKDQAAPHKGLLLDEKKATLLIAIRAERDRRRTELEAITRKAEIQKLIYESALENLRAQAAAKSTWWEQNKGLVGLVIGTTVGMAIVVGVMYALSGGKSLQTNTTQLTSIPR